MIWPITFAIILTLLVGPSSSQNDYDLSKIRDVLLEEEWRNGIEIVHVRKLVKKLEKLSQDSKYAPVLNADQQLYSDITRILTASREDDPKECEPLSLKLMLEREEQFSSNSLIYSYLRFAHEIIAARCLYRLDKKMLEAFDDIDRPIKDLHGKIFQRGKMLSLPSFKAPRPSFDGSNSDDPKVNAQARKFISTAAIVFSDDVIGDTHSMISFGSDLLFFKTKYSRLIFWPCNNFFREIRLTLTQFEVLDAIRRNYKISRLAEADYFSLTCSYLGSNPNDYMKVYRFYKEYVNGRTLLENPRMIISWLMGPTMQELMYTPLYQTELAHMMNNPAEIRHQLEIVSKMDIVLIPERMFFLFRALHISHPSVLCYEDHIVDLLDLILRDRRPEVRTFLTEFKDQQLKLCEEYLWLKFGEALQDTQLSELSKLESILRGIGTIVPPYVSTGIISSLLDLNIIPERDRRATRIYKSIMRTQAQGEYSVTEYLNWLDRTCSRYSRHLRESGEEISRIFNSLYMDPLDTGMLEVSFPPIILRARIYERICSPLTKAENQVISVFLQDDSLTYESILDRFRVQSS